MNKFDVIKKPVVTEKSTLLKEKNAYVFLVDLAATKPQIKQSVEELYKVKVRDVNVVVQHGHKKHFGKHIGMTPARKKAYVTLSEGKIEIFEGV